MRVTRESLIRIAKETAQERAYNDRDILAAYLTGSLVSDRDPMLGGATDIDLVLVHSTKPAAGREIVKLTPDFHLDICHRARSDFRSPRELRTDPLLGFEMYDPMLLHQTEKFFEFVQAGLRAGFEFQAPPLALARCRKLLAEARKGWIDLMDISPERAGPTQVKQFLRAAYAAGNAVAELNGAPLPERRFLLEFPARTLAVEHPNFAATMFNLIGTSHLEPGTLAGWLGDWRSAFLAAAQDGRVDARIHPARINYYEKAIQAMLEGEMPLAAAWPLIQTWTLAAVVLSEAQAAPWRLACEQLGLLGSGFEQRVQEMDQYLDQIEAGLDEIAAANGLETTGGR